MLFVLSGCGSKYTESKEQILSAKIRYFDGSMDTVLLESYSLLTGGSSVVLKTLEGRTIIVGINNVMIISESEEQFYCQN